MLVALEDSYQLVDNHSVTHSHNSTCQLLDALKQSMMQSNRESHYKGRNLRQSAPVVPAGPSIGQFQSLECNQGLLLLLNVLLLDP